LGAFFHHHHRNHRGNSAHHVAAKNVRGTLLVPFDGGSIFHFGGETDGSGRHFSSAHQFRQQPWRPIQRRFGPCVDRRLHVFCRYFRIWISNNGSYRWHHDSCDGESRL